MILNEQLFLEKRVQELVDALPNTNTRYAYLMEENDALFGNLESVFNSKQAITLDALDCMDMAEYCENEAEASRIAGEVLYRQGVRDCVSILKWMGVLA